MGGQQSILKLSRAKKDRLATAFSGFLLVGLFSWSHLSCDKIPLNERYGVFNHASVHWFENEKTAYVFFELNEPPERLLNPEWELHYGEGTVGGGEVDKAFAPLDFNAGVHQHRTLGCGSSLWCGSYSFKAEQKITRAELSFRYDKDSDLKNTVSPDVYVYPDNGTYAAFSALLYGTFDKNNELVRTNVQHNFNAPTHRGIAQYGMTRRFRINGLALQDVDRSIISVAGKENAPLFPSEFCTAPAAITPFVFAGDTGWIPDRLDINTIARGACLSTEFLDKNEAPIIAGNQLGYARRNPVLLSNDLTLETPQKEVTQIQLLIHICRDDTFAGSMIDEDFLGYQRHILQMDKTTPDICFRIGDETRFESELEDLLAAKVTEYKASSDKERDIAFVVLLHEIFSVEFKTIQSMVAAKLYQVVNAETSAVSPRIIGSMVYAGSVHFQPTAQQTKKVIWCPQQLLESVLDPLSAPLFNQNCTTQNAAEIDLRFINFVTPLGPFPSYDKYTEYVKDYGDRGLAKSPTLKIFSLPTSVTTIQEKNQTVSYFENERFTIAEGDFARTCPEDADLDYISFRIRPNGQPDDLPSLYLFEVDPLWLSAEAANSYRIGISWEFPFVATVDYTTALTGKVAATIPFQRSEKAYEQLGDPKWLRDSWNFGRFVQYCDLYCDNPFFDESGTYQISQLWLTYISEHCPTPLIPSVGG